jgi:hypothetical protein
MTNYDQVKGLAAGQREIKEAGWRQGYASDALWVMHSQCTKVNSRIAWAARVDMHR